MNGEILSIETAQKISRLEKENSEYEKIIVKFDKEVNRLFKIIKETEEYVDNVLLTPDGSIIDLKNILKKAKEEQNA